MNHDVHQTGWLTGLLEHHRDVRVDIVSLERPSPTKRELRMSLKTTPEVAARLKELRKPDRARGRHVEFTLLEPSVDVAAEGRGWRAVFESPWIECLTGENSGS